MNSRDYSPGADTRPRLEVLSALPTDKKTPATPLLFVHGAYTGAWCWAEHFLDFFAAAGHPAYALSLSGHGRSRGRRILDTFSIDDYVRDVCEVADMLTAEYDEPPILVGHSMGGFVVQKVLEKRVCPAAVLMCSVPPQGLMSSAMSLLVNKPNMLSELGRIYSGAGASMAALQESLFAQPVKGDDLERYYRFSQPESQRAIWDMSLFNLPEIHKVGRTPLLIQGAEFDHLIPPDLVRNTAGAYGTTPTIFEGMGHGLMLERDWRKPAQHILDWLK